MLIRFAATNFRSIAETMQLSMVAIDSERDAARQIALIGESLLTRAAVYGPNASGKSNVIAALGWVRDAARDSLRMWEDEVPIEPFAFGEWPARSSSFVIDATVDGVRHEYELEVTGDRVIHEALFEYPERRRRRVFEREGERLTLARGLGVLGAARELGTPRTLALSSMRRFEEPKVGRFITELLGWQVMGLSRGTRGFSGAPLAYPRGSTARLFEAKRDQPTLFGEVEWLGEVASPRDVALQLLRFADLGVEDVAIVEEQSIGRDGSPRTARRLQLMHRAGEARVPMAFDTESRGTQMWFHMIGPVVSALLYGTVLIVDELDASLHPVLCVELLRLFRDRVSNPRGAQLVFTAHDTSLLDELNRDEVWLTEKRADGSTRLGALSEFAGERVRQSRNLASAYLHGKFGAIPDVDRADLLRSLRALGIL